MSENVKTIYSDGIGKIHFFGNMIHLDLMAIVPVDVTNEDGTVDSKPTPVVTHRIVMPPTAFLTSYESFVNMIDKLQKAGVLSPVENKAEVPEGSPIEDAPAEDGGEGLTPDAPDAPDAPEQKPMADAPSTKVEDI